MADPTRYWLTISGRKVGSKRANIGIVALEAKSWVQQGYSVALHRAEGTKETGIVRVSTSNTEVHAEFEPHPFYTGPIPPWVGTVLRMINTNQDTNEGEPSE